MLVLSGANLKPSVSLEDGSRVIISPLKYTDISAKHLAHLATSSKMLQIGQVGLGVATVAQNPKNLVFLDRSGSVFFFHYDVG